MEWISLKLYVKYQKEIKEYLIFKNSIIMHAFHLMIYYLLNQDRETRYVYEESGPDLDGL